MTEGQGALFAVPLPAGTVLVPKALVLAAAQRNVEDAPFMSETLRQRAEDTLGDLVPMQEAIARRWGMLES